MDLSLQPVFSSFSVVALSEMGDKTQLLALALAARFRRPLVVLAGIFVATVANHALAVLVGSYGAAWLEPETLRWGLGGLFIAFGLWALKPDSDPGLEETHTARGAFWATTVAFFFAEMGDKTQFATAALAARFPFPVAVTLGTTLGMMVADGIAVFLGDRFAERIPLQPLRIASALLFIAIGVWTWVK